MHDLVQLSATILGNPTNRALCSGQALVSVGQGCTTRCFHTKEHASHSDLLLWVFKKLDPLAATLETSSTSGRAA